MATKTWEIVNMERDLEDGYVKLVSYVVSSKEGSNTYTYGDVVFLPKPSTLAAYNTLTSEVVIGWVKARLNELNAENTIHRSVAEIEAIVDSGLAKTITPTTAKGTPW